MNVVKLSEAVFNKIYFIKEINLKNQELKQQLKNLGFIEKEKIIILNHNYGKKSFLVKVMGVNYAVEKNICDSIVVEYE